MEIVKTVTILQLTAFWMRLTLQCPDVDLSLSNQTGPATDAKIALNIIGLFDMTGDYPAGIAYYLAALLAIKHINEYPHVLPGYTLQINAYDTKCVESRGLQAFYKEVYNPNRTSLMVLGATCSAVTEATAQVSVLWGLSQISYSAISPHLSNRVIFPNFFRVMTPEQNLTVGRVKLFKEFSWKKAHIIYENLRTFSTLNEYMKDELEKNDVQVVSNEMFTVIRQPLDLALSLKRKDARIIIVNMYEDKARKIMCEVYNLKGSRKWYKKIVWFFPFFYDRNWMQVHEPSCNCTTKQILEVIGNYFSVGSPAFVLDEGYKTLKGMSAVEFYREYMDEKLYSSVAEEIPAHFQELYNKSVAKGGLFCQQRAPEAYDAVWAIALALNNTLRTLINNNSNRCLEDFRYNDKQFSNLLRDGMNQVMFNAVSGPFSFNSNKERTTGIDIMQYNNKYGGGLDSSITVVGNCVKQSETSGWNCTVDQSMIYWANGQVPVDGVQVQNRTLNIDQRIVLTSSAMACLGIALSAGLLVFNILHRDHRIIKMSSPRLNNIILVGCVLGYSTILLLDVQWGDSGVACVLRTFTIVMSFSLTFGAFFAKTWRVYEIFTAGIRVLNRRMLRDSSLFLIIAILVLVNCLTLVGWMVASPQKPTFVTIDTTPVSNVKANDNNDVTYTNVFQRCDSTYRLHFTWALVAIQGMVILLGTYLAIQTRKVTFPELNDSKWVALCIYNLVVLGPVGVVVVMATEDKPEINYALEAGILILVTAITKGLIFGPKIIAYRKHNRLPSPSVDISVNLRHIKENLGAYTLDPGALNRNEISGMKRKITSSNSCKASLETDLSYLTCHNKCIWTLAETSLSEEHTSGQLGKSHRNVDTMKHLRRSKSDSNIRDVLDSSFLEQLAEYRHQDIGGEEYQNPSKCTQENVEIFWKNLALRRCKEHVACESENASGLVLDAIKVKAALKVLPKCELRTNCGESRGHVNNTDNIYHLLNRLKQVVKAGENTEKQT